MNLNVENILLELLTSYPKLTNIKNDIKDAYEILAKSFEQEGQVLIAGNGGSSCDSGHIVGELMKGFIKRREVTNDQRKGVEGINSDDINYLYDNLQNGMRAIDLTSQQGLITAISNDNGSDLVFAQQVWAYGKKSDVFLGLSTSGNSENIIKAGMVAKLKGMKTIGFSGENPNKMDDFFDVVIKVPSSSTPTIQEFHLPIYHTICLMLEETFF